MLVELDDPNVIRNLAEKVSSHIKRSDERDLQTANEIKQLQQSLCEMEEQNAAMKEENTDLKEQLAKQMIVVEQVGRDANRLVVEIKGMADNMDGLKGLLDMLPGKIKMPKVDMHKATGFPVTSPSETCKSVISYLRQAATDPEVADAVKSIKGKIYADLAHAKVQEGLPHGLSASVARDTLRRAKLAKRPVQEELVAIGWRKMPSFGVVIET